jgi:hypothetical protein
MKQVECGRLVITSNYQLQKVCTLLRLRPLRLSLLGVQIAGLTGTAGLAHEAGRRRQRAHLHRLGPARPTTGAPLRAPVVILSARHHSA